MKFSLWVLVCLKGDRSEAWKMGCICQFSGKDKQQLRGLRTLMTLNGPSLFGANFLLSCHSLRFFDLTLKGLKPLVVLSIIFCLANS